MQSALLGVPVRITPLIEPHRLAVLPVVQPLRKVRHPRHDPPESFLVGVRDVSAEPLDRTFVPDVLRAVLVDEVHNGNPLGAAAGDVVLLPGPAFLEVLLGVRPAGAVGAVGTVGGGGGVIELFRGGWGCGGVVDEGEAADVVAR